MEATQEQVTLALDEYEEHLFITGGAGTGKSYVVNQWLETVDKAKVAICAPTGVAALNVGGITNHRMFHIPYSIAEPEYQAAVAARKMKPEKKLYLQRITTVLMDEISMCRSDVLTYIDLILKEVRDDETPFGGVRLVGVGDPFQLPPVVPKHEKEKIPNPWFFQAPIWQEANVQTLNLTKIYRQAGDTTFAQILNNIRRGSFTFDDLSILSKRRDSARDDAMILGTTNRRVDERNENELKKIDEPEHCLVMDYVNHVDDYKIENNVPAPINLFLKVGARVMMLNNQGRWVNGSLAYVREINVSHDDPNKHFLMVELDAYPDELFKVYRHTWVAEECSMDDDILKTEILGEATQFPVKLGYAITVHKSQGMTFDNVHFALDYVFERGQTYVALSRATSLDGLTLGNSIKGKHIMCDKAVKEFMKDS